MPSAEERRDPLHRPCHAPVTWTRTNISEALPGVATPLGFTIVAEPVELGVTQMFHDLGAFPASRITATPPIERSVLNVFYGRVAENVEVLREAAAALPGGSPAAVDEMLFGTGMSTADNRRVLRRYPVAVVKMPIALAGLHRRLRQVSGEAASLWATTAAAPPAELGAARALLAESARVSTRILRQHMLGSMLAQTAFEQLTKLAASAGHPGLETSLATGLGGLTERAIADDAWAVSRQLMSLDEFLARHGYLAPGGSELSSRSWREDTGPVRRTVDAYRAMPDAESPAARERQRAADRQAAEATLRRALGPVGRARAAAVLRLRGFVFLREHGKNAWLKALDTGRFAARAAGDALVRAGRLDDADDIFYLALTEITGRLPPEAHELIDERRRRRAEYEGFDLPTLWTGMPTPQPIAAASAVPQERVTGLPVAPGIVQGTVRVVLDPSDCSDGLTPGEILVCRTTDPSWTAMFMTAGAVVIDKGGVLSHGAIVARELGIPCVINTRNGTTELSTGDHVRVDGSAGEVVVLHRKGRTINV